MIDNFEDFKIPDFLLIAIRKNYLQFKNFIHGGFANGFSTLFE